MHLYVIIYAGPGVREALAAMEQDLRNTVIHCLKTQLTVAGGKLRTEAVFKAFIGGEAVSYSCCRISTGHVAISRLAKDSERKLARLPRSVRYGVVVQDLLEPSDFGFGGGMVSFAG